MNDNWHIQAIPPEVLAQVQNKINEIKDLLAQYLRVLTPGERHGMAKMGERTVRFVEKAFDLARDNPHLIPPYLDMDAFLTDLQGAKSIWPLENNACQLKALLGDTEMAAGSEAYKAALTFYRYVKMAASQNVPGAESVYDELKIRFPTGRHRPAKSENSD